MDIHPLAQAALDGVGDDSIERRPTFCYRVKRQLRQRVYGPKYDQYDSHSDRPTAAEAEAKWRESPFVVDQDQGTVVGDIFFWDDGGDGHVGIRVPGNLIMDNSSSRKGRVSGAKGFRRMADMPKPTTVIRLPRPAKKRR